MTKTYDINDVAAEMDRLFADDSDIVDTTERSWGHGTEAGHVGHDNGDEPHVVGWYCDAGNIGNPVLSIEPDDVQRAGETMAAMESARSLSDVERALSAADVRYSRLT